MSHDFDLPKVDAQLCKLCGKQHNPTEVCDLPYEIQTVVEFDKKACCSDITKVLYIIFSALFLVFACPFAMLGYTLFTINSNSNDAGYVTIGIGAFYIIFIWICISLFQTETRKISPIEYFNGSRLLKAATIANYVSISIIVIQLLGLIIANPILGRPVAFTPRGELFGITLGLIVGLLIVAFVVYWIVRGVQWIIEYTNNKWIKRTDVVVRTL